MYFTERKPCINPVQGENDIKSFDNMVLVNIFRTFIHSFTQ